MALTNQFYLKPADGKRVRDPVTGQALPAEGAYKPRIAYWFRRVRDKDVAETDPPAAPAAAPTPAAAPSAEAQQLADVEAALKTAEAAVETAAGTGSKTTSTKGGAK